VPFVDEPDRVMEDDYSFIESKVRRTAYTLYHVHSSANLYGSRLLHPPSQGEEGVVSSIWLAWGRVTFATR
jgi:hypothetical protein